jgi:hypothetical protein
MFLTTVVEIQNTFHVQNLIFEKRVAFDVDWKNTSVPGRQATHDNMLHVHCMQDT